MAKVCQNKATHNTLVPNRAGALACANEITGNSFGVRVPALSSVAKQMQMLNCACCFLPQAQLGACHFPFQKSLKDATLLEQSVNSSTCFSTFPMFCSYVFPIMSHDSPKWQSWAMIGPKCQTFASQLPTFPSFRPALFQTLFTSFLSHSTRGYIILHGISNIRSKDT